MKKYLDLWNLTQGYRRLYFIAFLAMGLGSFLAFITPLVGKITIDYIVISESSSTSQIMSLIIQLMGGKDFLSTRLWIPAMVLVLVSITSGLFLYLKDRLSIRSCEQITKSLRERLYNHIQHSRLLPFSKYESGDLVQRCTSDIDTVRIFLSKQVVEISRALVMLVLIVPMMFTLNSKMALVSLCLIPIVVSFSYLFFRKIKSVFLKVDQSEGALTTTLQENLTGIRVVRAFTRQQFEIEKFRKRNAALTAQEFELIKVLGIYWGISDFLCIAQTGITLFCGGWLASRGEITIGTLYAFLNYLGILMWPIRQMGRTLTDTGKAVVSLGRITEVLTIPLEKDKTDRKPNLIKSANGMISLSKVGYSFEQQSPALSNISFDIPAGKTVAIVGPTGSGKSTLIRLLLRLYDYQSGSIQLDGVELTDIPRKELRKKMGAVLQEPYIYAKTARDNIRVADGSKLQQEIVTAANDACIHRSILTFKNGYDTDIGERGVNLSGGQKQRVTMARSFLKSVPVLLWDDALSAVDVETENQILETLQHRYGKLTTVLVTHRLSICQKVEKIIVLDKGRIVQEGSHWELVSQPGFYKTVWDIQKEIQE